MWVTIAPVDAGETLHSELVASRELPLITLPDDAARTSPEGRRSTVGRAAGEILRVGRLADGTGLAALVPPGHGAVSLREPADHLAAGNLVDLHALLTGAVVATNTRVLEIVEGAPVVAVSDADLDAVMRAFTTGDVVAVLVG